MKVSFALLTTNEIHNYSRKVAFDINKKYRTGFYAAQLPPHISLKQPFEISDINEVEKYMEEFAESIEPFEISIPRLNYWVSEEVGSIYLEVEESQILRDLHNRLNKELKVRFGNTSAMFDGDEYRFHLTIALGGKCPKEVYEEFYREVVEKEVNFKYTAKEIVMFYFDNDNYELGTSMTYKRLLLGKGNNK